MIGNLFRPQAKLARGGLHGGQTRFGQVQRLRIELDAIGITTQLARRLMQGFRRAFQQSERLAQGGVNGGQIGQVAAQGAQTIEHAGLFRLQRFAGALRAGRQIRRMRQTTMFFLQVLPALQREIEPAEFLLHPGQAFTFGVLFAGMALGGLASGGRFTPGAISARSIGGKFGAAAEGIQQTALFGSLEQRVMRMLAMNIDQELAQLFQLLGSRRAAVDEGARAASGFNHAAHQQHIVVAGQIIFPQPVGQAAIGWRGEFGRHLGARGAFAYHAGIGTLAKNQRDGIEQDGLAGAGLASEHGKTGREIQRKLFDQNEIANG